MCRAKKNEADASLQRRIRKYIARVSRGRGATLGPLFCIVHVLYTRERSESVDSFLINQARGRVLIGNAHCKRRIGEAYLLAIERVSVRDKIEFARSVKGNAESVFLWNRGTRSGSALQSRRLGRMGELSLAYETHYEIDHKPNDQEIRHT
jgi:hypothetical protein